MTEAQERRNQYMTSRDSEQDKKAREAGEKTVRQVVGDKIQKVMESVSARRRKRGKFQAS